MNDFSVSAYVRDFWVAWLCYFRIIIVIIEVNNQLWVNIGLNAWIMSKNVASCTADKWNKKNYVNIN